jgi:hypothetical protein
LTEIEGNMNTTKYLESLGDNVNWHGKLTSAPIYTIFSIF